MNTKSRTSHRITASFLAAAVAGGIAAATPAAATNYRANDSTCSFDPASLPRTPDAVEGWYDQCRAQHDVATGLPKTADAVEGWYIQRRTGVRIPITSGQPNTDASEAPTADPPANWRRLMNEIPEG
jgi:hypothetical protein